eukprot:gene5626-5589_t
MAAPALAAPASAALTASAAPGCTAPPPDRRLMVQCPQALESWQQATGTGVAPPRGGSRRHKAGA